MVLVARVHLWAPSARRWRYDSALGYVLEKSSTGDACRSRDQALPSSQSDRVICTASKPTPEAFWAKLLVRLLSCAWLRRKQLPCRLTRCWLLQEPEVCLLLSPTSLPTPIVLPGDELSLLLNSLLPSGHSFTECPTNCKWKSSHESNEASGQSGMRLCERKLPTDNGQHHLPVFS